MSEDLQQRAQPFGLILVRFPDGRVRIGSPGRYITFANREAASSAIDLLELVSPEKRSAPRPTLAELEAILADESPVRVVVNADGSVSAVAELAKLSTGQAPVGPASVDKVASDGSYPQAATETLIHGQSPRVSGPQPVDNQ